MNVIFDALWSIVLYLKRCSLSKEIKATAALISILNTVLFIIIDMRINTFISFGNINIVVNIIINTPKSMLRTGALVAPLHT